MKITKTIALSLALGLSTALMATPNVPIGDMKAGLAKMAGEKGIFAKHEMFPKDYFLISKNLPFSVGLTLHHPQSSKLGLSKEQIDKIKQIKADTMPKVIESALKIKKLELALSQRMMSGAKAEDELSAVDAIASKKAALTKEHLRCIASVRAILEPAQRKILLSYASAKMKKSSAKKHKAGAVELPHPMHILMSSTKELNISNKQQEQLDAILATVPTKMHAMMDMAETLEHSIKEAVMHEKKTKESLASDIDFLQSVKREISDTQISTINRIQNILSDKQYDGLITKLRAAHKGHKKHKH